MGIACGDVDRDGHLDLGVSNFYHEYYTFYRNLEGNGFEDSSLRYQLAGKTRTSMGWGTQFFDADNDGWLDLFVSNGHINRSRDGSFPYGMPAQLFLNSGQSRFVEVGSQAGPYFQQDLVGRGAAFGDYDNDGREDIAVVHHHSLAALLHNESPASSRALVLRLIGRQSARDAFNARVVAVLANGVGDGPVLRELVPGTSYLSANDYRIRFGLGGDTTANIVVTWPSGQIQNWSLLKPGGTLVLREQLPDVAHAP
jgi:hypothetical protein